MDYKRGKHVSPEETMFHPRDGEADSKSHKTAPVSVRFVSVRGKHRGTSINEMNTMLFFVNLSQV